MADKAKAKVSFTPIVTLAADADSDAVDAIHHDIKGTLGGTMEFEKVNENDKWFYRTDIDIDTTGGSTDILSASKDRENTFTDSTCDYDDDPTITMNSTSALAVNMYVTGTGIPDFAYVRSITNSTTFELGLATNNNALSTTGGAVTDGTLTFGTLTYTDGTRWTQNDVFRMGFIKHTGTTDGTTPTTARVRYTDSGGSMGTDWENIGSASFELGPGEAWVFKSAAKGSSSDAGHKLQSWHALSESGTVRLIIAGLCDDVSESD